METYEVVEKVPISDLESGVISKSPLEIKVRVPRTLRGQPLYGEYTDRTYLIIAEKTRSSVHKKEIRTIAAGHLKDNPNAKFLLAFGSVVNKGGVLTIHNKL